MGKKVNKSERIRAMLADGYAQHEIVKKTGYSSPLVNIVYKNLHKKKSKAKKPSKIIEAVKETKTALDRLRHKDYAQTVKERMDLMKASAPYLYEPSKYKMKSALESGKKLLTKKDDRQNAKEWHKQNKWFGVDEKKTAKALLLHEKLIQKGISPTENPNEYYSRIDIGMMDNKLTVKENGIAFDLVKTPDSVNHPPHYTKGGIETIDFIEAKDLNYRLGNVIKYVSRAGNKLDSDPVQDLEKAAFYLKREIERRKNA